MTKKCIPCFGLASLLLVGGCAGVPKREKSYQNLLLNMQAVENSLDALEAPPLDPETPKLQAPTQAPTQTPTPTPTGTPEKPTAAAPERVAKSLRLPLMEARYCVERAMDAARRAEHNSGADTALIILGGSSVAYGMAASAGGAALPDESSHRQWLLLSGSVSTAAAAGIFALRTSLSMSDVAREHRIAAARNVNAAMGILLHYAVTDDAVLTDGDDFITCRDSDIAIANAYPGVKSQDSSVIKQGEQAAKDKQAAATTAEATNTKAKAVETAAEIELKAEVSTLKAQLEAALAEAKRPQTGVASIQSFGTLEAEVSKITSDTESRTERLTEAAKSFIASASASVKTESAKKAVEAVKEETVKVEKKKAEVEAAKATAAGTQCELDRARARANIAERQLDALRAASRFRRAVLLQTPADVTIAGRLLQDAFVDLRKGRDKLDALEGATCSASAPAPTPEPAPAPAVPLAVPPAPTPKAPAPKVPAAPMQ
jgi:hypothetical protein